MKNILMSFLTATAVVFLLSGHAAAETKLEDVSVKFSDRGTDGPPSKIVVSGQNGKHTTLKSFELRIPLKLHAAVKNVDVQHKITLAKLAIKPDNSFGTTSPIGPGVPSGGKPNVRWIDYLNVDSTTLNSARRKIDEKYTFAPAEWQSNGIGQKALELCKWEANRVGPNAEHRHTLNVTVIWQVWAAKGSQDATRKSSETTASVQVICEPVGTKPTLEIKSFTVRADQSDTTCPKDYRIAVSFYLRRQPTQTRANVKFHLVVDGNRRPLIVRTMSRQPTFFNLTYGEELKLSPGAHTIRVIVEDGPTSETITRQVTCPPFAASAMWLTVDQQNKSSCPKDVRAQVRITANGPGTILTKIKNQAGAVMAIEPIKVERKGNEYEGLLKQTFRMGEIDTMLIAENVNNTGQNTGWQPLKITCLKPIKGTLTLQDPDAPVCSRQARAAISIQTTIPGKVPFRLSCSGGRNLTGRLDAHQTAPGTFLAVRVKTFTINKNEHINCALKTKVDGAWKTVALQGRQFECIKRTDTAGPNNLTTPVQPTHSEPDRMPPVVVTPEPPRTMVDCARGFTKVGRRCVRITCPRGEKLINGRCIQRIVECLRGFKKFGQSCIRITCQRGERLVNGHCKAITVSCPDGYTKLRGKCIKPATRPVQCANGRLVRGRCVSGRPLIKKRGNGQAARIGRSQKAARRN